MSKPITSEVRRLVGNVLTYAVHNNFRVCDGRTTIAVFEYGVRIREINQIGYSFPDSQLSIRFMNGADPDNYGNPILEWHGQARHAGDLALGRFKYCIKHTKTVGWVFWNS